MITFALLPGDGIGPEVLAGPAAVLRRLMEDGFLEVSGPWPVGASSYLATGDGLPQQTLEACEAANAILFGAVGDHPGFHAPQYRPETSLIFLREYFDLRLSIRQVWRPNGEPLAIVRNLLGGAYGGSACRKESDGRAPASDLVQLTPQQIREVVETAVEIARRTRVPLLSVDKANLWASSRLWRRITTETVERLGVACSHVYVDRCAFDLARFGLPRAVIVSEGLFGDILSDLAAAVAGSIALCSSASLHPGAAPRGNCVGLFEPVHGTAPDITGQDRANPAGAYLALASALEWFRETAPFAAMIRQALAQILSEGPFTADRLPPGKQAVGTDAFAQALNRLIWERL